MNRKFLGKVGLIGALILVLLVPLYMVEGVIRERSSYRDEAKAGIAESWTGPQQMLGPMVVVPYVEHLSRERRDEKSGAVYTENYAEERRLFVLPEQLRINGQVSTEERSRGIYSVPVYGAALEVEGSFSNQAVIDAAKRARGTLEWQAPFLAVVLGDIRGVVTQPRLKWAGTEREFASGSGVPEHAVGMHASLDRMATAQPAQYAFSFAVDLRGMERIEFSPMGKSTEVVLGANWPHPSFIGRYLPSERSIGKDAFTARWQVSSFSSNMQAATEQLGRGYGNEFLANTFGVSLVNPVDVYQTTERSVKYGVLFVALTFVAFFLYEVMKGLRLHPMQYLLVGLALTTFYLLLISLSEHVGFAVAYLVAATACVGLIGFYIRAMLESRGRAAAFSGMLVLLYGMLFAILRSEDNALLMGSLLLFGVLSLVMMVTRKLDWYSVGEQTVQQRQA